MTKEERNEFLALKRKVAKENRIIARIDGIGEIEDVYGTGTSFNVLSFVEGRTGSRFYKSAYTKETADKYLNELIKKKDEREKRVKE